MDNITCGVFIFTSENKLLIGQPTGSNVWSIPKGLQDEGETLLETAVREFKEETNFDLNPNAIYHFKEEFKYINRNKTLKAFYTFIPNEFEAICHSMVNKEGKEPFPEMCQFKWATIDEALSLIHEAQVRALKVFITELK